MRQNEDSKLQIVQIFQIDCILRQRDRSLSSVDRGLHSCRIGVDAGRGGHVSVLVMTSTSMLGFSVGTIQWRNKCKILKRSDKFTWLQNRHHASFPSTGKVLHWIQLNETRHSCDYDQYRHVWTCLTNYKVSEYYSKVEEKTEI